jgi:hypothetical protein
MQGKLRAIATVTTKWFSGTLPLLFNADKKMASNEAIFTEDADVHPLPC